jgi:4'-phosphopantetheinyl transferase
MRRSSSQHVWFASIPAVFRLIDPAQALSGQELRRAESIKMPADRDRFLAGRMLLRYVLTQRTGGAIPVSSWRYRDGLHGKPIVDAGLPSLEFNLSHSGICVAVAVGKGQPLGIDIESIAPEDCDDIVPDVLTERELGRLDVYSRDRQRVEFIRIWTMKEACAKALGFGAAIDFRSLEVELEAQPTIRSSLDPGQEFGVATTIICCESRPYCLSLVTARGMRHPASQARFLR